jgi:hypothetical protein
MRSRSISVRCLVQVSRLPSEAEYDCHRKCVMPNKSLERTRDG